MWHVCFLLFAFTFVGHRFEQMPGMHRPKIAKRKGALHSIVHVGKSQREKRERFKRKLFDHNPHEVGCVSHEYLPTFGIILF